MIRGAGAALKKRLRLKDVNDYHYLNQSGCTVVSHVDDMDEYEDVVSAMEALDFKQAEVTATQRASVYSVPCVLSTKGRA